MPHLRKFKVTVRRHNFLPPPRRQRRTLPGGQERRGWLTAGLPSPPLVTGDRERERETRGLARGCEDRQPDFECNRYWIFFKNWVSLLYHISCSCLLRIHTSRRERGRVFFRHLADVPSLELIPIWGSKTSGYNFFGVLCFLSNTYNNL